MATNSSRTQAGLTGGKLSRCAFQGLSCSNAWSNAGGSYHRGTERGSESVRAEWSWLDVWRFQFHENTVSGKYQQVKDKAATESEQALQWTTHGRSFWCLERMCLIETRVDSYRAKLESTLPGAATVWGPQKFDCGKARWNKLVGDAIGGVAFSRHLNCSPRKNSESLVFFWQTVKSEGNGVMEQSAACTGWLADCGQGSAASPKACSSRAGRAGTVSRFRHISNVCKSSFFELSAFLCSFVTLNVLSWNGGADAYWCPCAQTSSTTAWNGRCPR